MTSFASGRLTHQRTRLAHDDECARGEHRGSREMLGNAVDHAVAALAGRHFRSGARLVFVPGRSPDLSTAGRHAAPDRRGNRARRVRSTTRPRPRNSPDQAAARSAPLTHARRVTSLGLNTCELADFAFQR